MCAKGTPRCEPSNKNASSTFRAFSSAGVRLGDDQLRVGHWEKGIAAIQIQSAACIKFPTNKISPVLFCDVVTVIPTTRRHYSSQRHLAAKRYYLTTAMPSVFLPFEKRRDISLDTLCNNKARDKFLRPIFSKNGFYLSQIVQNNENKKLYTFWHILTQTLFWFVCIGVQPWIK